MPLSDNISLAVRGLIAAFGLAACSTTQTVSPAPFALSDYATVAQPRLSPLEVNLKPPTEKLLYAFKPAVVPGGYISRGGDGSLFGVVPGADGLSTVFQLERAGKGYHLRRSYTFAGGAGGSFANAGLIMDQSHALYGTAASGGTSVCHPYGCGVVFKLTPRSDGYEETILHNFHRGADGAVPTSGVIADDSGALYGTTESGGAGGGNSGGCGTVYKLTPSSGGGYVESVLYAFQCRADGAYPTNPLTLDPSGALYGTARGGKFQNGVAFKLTPSTSGYSESTIYEFGGSLDDGIPNTPLVLGEGGSLYGTSDGFPRGFICQGRGDGCGVVFELSPGTPRYHQHVIYAFRGGTDGSLPVGLTLVGNTMYGTTFFGGPLTHCYPYGCGTLFELAQINGTYRKSTLYDFNFGGGAQPRAGLLVENDGRTIVGEEAGQVNDAAVWEITR